MRGDTTASAEERERSDGARAANHISRKTTDLIVLRVCKRAANLFLFERAATRSTASYRQGVSQG